MPGPSINCNRVAPDARLAPLLAAFPPQLFDERLYRSIHWADDYVLALVLAVLWELGVPSVLMQPVSASEIGRLLGLAPTFAPRLAWLLDRVAAAGLLTTANIDGGRVYRCESPWPAPAVDDRAAAGLAIDPGNQPTIALLQAAVAVCRGSPGGR